MVAQATPPNQFNGCRIKMIIEPLATTTNSIDNVSFYSTILHMNLKEPNSGYLTSSAPDDGSRDETDQGPSNHLGSSSTDQQRQRLEALDRCSDNEVEQRKVFSSKNHWITDKVSYLCRRLFHYNVFQQ